VEDILAITLLFGGGTLFLLSISPVGRAIADRIRRSGGDLSHDLAARIRESQLAVEDELEALRHEVAEVQERLDFAERLLAKHREPEQLAPGEDVGS
jgi:hypothetical protein